ncbi:MAG: HNH endonuclease [Zavarzinella sp.]|nr:HNH endonuclease [Zavarzinella sp.]
MIGAAIRRRVRERAGNRCEYCRTHQEDEPFVAYQIEHVIAIQHGGGDEEDNLALACSHCNLHKGPNLAGIDPATGRIEPLFHPRRQSWDEHFEFRGSVIEGKTPCGRATVRVLAMNAEVRVDLRQELERGEAS